MPLPQRVDLDPWVLFTAVAVLAMSLWLARSVRVTHDTRGAELGELLAIAALATGACALLLGELGTILWPAAIFLLLSIAVARGARNLSIPGAAWLAITFQGLCTTWLWSCLFINELTLSQGFEALALMGVTVTFAVSLLASVERIAREAVLTHGSWSEPTHAPAMVSRHYQPRVSIQLPCYAEPPEIVKATMDHLAALDYPDFEVLVCDNNTKDEALWRPLEAYSAELNERLGREVFRFFHVAPLPGAKAGALNWLLDRMDPQAEIVAVIDADYLSTPDFLARLVPFFEDPQIGYLQTPHDYRDYENSAFLSACYAEYMPNNKVDMLGVHEYGGAFTIGTMCLLRTRALRAAGGWAEWCLTEDSEVSVRIRAVGYRGYYLSETFGRGLIPDTFDDYKKQRFRWTAGPVQQLMRHWRLFLPAPYARPMPGWTKLLEILRCMAPLQTLAGIVTGLFMLGGVTIAIYAGEIGRVNVPDVTWPLLALTLVTTLVRIRHRYKLSGIHRLADMVRGEVARASLTYVVLLSGIAGLSGKPLAWRRTPKFGGADTLGGALWSAAPETALAFLSLVGCGLVLAAMPRIGWELTVLGASGLGVMALQFLCAPYMAILALRGDRPEATDGHGPQVPAVA
ncbi:glycosyltransferase [Croceibacterium ferulae]|uniref:glycosyltransferase n=1 Tax=Croceibacterium ferulae TaxID=1854641 RepID=UPI0013902D3D|nr:glycosyltransferase [Croceibacterium ferulae]